MVFVVTIVVLGATCFVGWRLWEDTAQWINATVDDHERRAAEREDSFPDGERGA